MPKIDYGTVSGGGKQPSRDKPQSSGAVRHARSTQHDNIETDKGMPRAHGNAGTAEGATRSNKSLKGFPEGKTAS